MGKIIVVVGDPPLAQLEMLHAKFPDAEIITAKEAENRGIEVPIQEALRVPTPADRLIDMMSMPDIILNSPPCATHSKPYAGPHDWLKNKKRGGKR